DWHGSPGDADELVNTSNNTLTDYGEQVAAAMAAETTTTEGGTTGSGTPPPPANPSLNGTQIEAVTDAPLIDTEGNSWTLVASASKGLQIAVNGSVDQTTANVVLLETVGGQIVQENTAGNWY